MSTLVHIVCGGQFGSEAKGHMAALLAEREPDSTFVRVGGPNAGHTVYDSNGIAFPFRHIPVSAVVNSGPLVLGPGSEIDIDVLRAEIELCEQHGHQVRDRLFVSEQATMLTDTHKSREKDLALHARLGSTGKGIGAARAARLMRSTLLAADVEPDFREMGVEVVGAMRLDSIYQTSPEVVVEGTQGYGLGLHAGFYPFCTSGDCRAIDFYAQSGLRSGVVVPWVVYRPYPIRVAGNSGPLAYETTWEALGERTGGYIQPERTTVTKLVRRVGEWDAGLARLALDDNRQLGQPVPVLMFVDYLDPTLAGTETMQAILHSPAWPRIEQMEQDLGQRFALFGTGPATHVWRAS